MARQTISCCQDGSDQIWSQLYITLRPTIRSWIHRSGMLAWRGQVEDLVDDILQETVASIHTYMRLAEQGVHDPIVSLAAFSRTVAHNHFKDLLRKERRLVPFSLYDAYGHEDMLLVFSDGEDPAEVALEGLIRAQKMVVAACLIIRLPRKQRVAVLTDLANRWYPQKDERLQKALLHVGIQLSDYQHSLSSDPRKRSQHAALLSTAYKRLRVTLSTRENKYVA